MKESDSRVTALRALVRDVPDFPKPGIVFKDITPLLAQPRAFHDAIELMAEAWFETKVDAVLGIESRGFLLGAPLALRLNAAFVPVRKPGKLPRETCRVEYALEYGSDAVEVHADALRPGERVLIVDDVIATGGTAKAAVDLAFAQGAEVVGSAFLLELTFLRGRERLAGRPSTSVLRY